MSSEDPVLSEREAMLEAWFEGDLRPEDEARLIARAEGDPNLAALMEQYRLLRSALAEQAQQRAPAGLGRRLRRIPHQHRRPAWMVLARPVWGGGLAAACLALLLFMNIAPPEESGGPSEAEIARGRQELAVALAYLDRAHQRTRDEIGLQLRGAVTEPVTGTMAGVVARQLVPNKEDGS